MANSCQLSTPSMAGKQLSTVDPKHGRQTAVSCRPKAWPANSCQLSTPSMADKQLSAVYHQHGRRTAVNPRTANVRDHSVSGQVQYYRSLHLQCAMRAACSSSWPRQLVDSRNGCSCRPLAWQLSGHVLFWPWCWERGNPLGQPAASPNSTGLSVARQDLFHGFRIYSIYRYRY